jgi:hypothetical protein
MHDPQSPLRATGGDDEAKLGARLCFAKIPPGFENDLLHPFVTGF